MPRPRKPKIILQLQGTLRKDRHARRADLELDNELPQCPDYLSEEAKDEWRTLVRDSQYSKVLARVDAGMIELYVVLRCEFKKHVKEGTEMQASRMTVMMNAGSKLGLNPSDRTRINIPPQPEQQDEFAKLAAEVQGRPIRAN